MHPLAVPPEETENLRRLGPIAAEPVRHPGVELDHPARPDLQVMVATAGPPTKHELALMIWLAVFPTLTVLNLALGHWLSAMTPVLRTFLLATIAVPIVIYGLMPQLHRLRVLPLSRVSRG